LINNRQAGRRNRGRNNGRQNGGNRGGENGNRVDNRARGNAPQLLEKYRNLARDAQLAGDRVNTEYYLQFADHYFRVLADNRARQEEQQARFRRHDDSFDDDAGDDDTFDDMAPPVRAEAEGGNRRGPSRRFDRDAGPAGVAPAEAAQSMTEADAPDEDAAPVRAPRGRKPRRPREEDQGTGEAPGLSLDALPPAIGRADNDSDHEDATAEEAPAPRRRGRRPRAAAEAAE